MLCSLTFRFCWLLHTHTATHRHTLPHILTASDTTHHHKASDTTQRQAHHTASHTHTLHTYNHTHTQKASHHTSHSVTHTIQPHTPASAHSLKPPYTLFIHHRKEKKKEKIRCGLIINTNFFFFFLKKKTFEKHITPRALHASTKRILSYEHSLTHTTDLPLEY